MRSRRRFWRGIGIAYILLALVAISACAPYLELTEPMIVVDPVGGPAGTSVAVSGSGFPPQAWVSVRLGPPSVGATPHSYGDAITDVDGRVTLSFTVPAFWPDGAPFGGADLVVVVINQDGSAKAAAPFVYVPPSSAETLALPKAQEAHLPLILAWHREGGTDGFCGDVLVYEGGAVEIVSCRPSVPLERRQLAREAVEQVNAWTTVYHSFQVEQMQGSGLSQVRTRTTFVGHGHRSVSDAELRMIQALIERLVAPRS